MTKNNAVDAIRMATDAAMNATYVHSAYMAAVAVIDALVGEDEREAVLSSLLLHFVTTPEDAESLGALLDSIAEHLATKEGAG